MEGAVRPVFYEPLSSTRFFVSLTGSPSDREPSVWPFAQRRSVGVAIWGAIFGPNFINYLLGKKLHFDSISISKSAVISLAMLVVLGVSCLVVTKSGRHFCTDAGDRVGFA